MRNGLMLLAALSVSTTHLPAAESIWLEAEHMEGIKGYCWPMGKPEMKKTAGHWGLSGPGWAAEWAQGGESGFLSIATAGDDDKAVVTKTVEVPAAGKYAVWVRYGDWREKSERFQITIEQEGKSWIGKYGEQPVIDEDNEMKLYFGWAFAWAKQEVELKKGPAKISLATTQKDPEPRQVDVIVLTTDGEYRPLSKERPASATWAVLEGYRQNRNAVLESLVRKKPAFELPDAWKPRTFRDKGFLYLWNVNPTDAWLGDDPKRVLYPYRVNDDDTRKEFEAKYGGQKDVPIFSDPRIVPTFHGAGAAIFATDPKTGELTDGGKKFVAWLDKNPDRPWAMMMNYAGPRKVGDKGLEAFLKYKNRYVGSISGENLGYFDVNSKKMQEATANAKTRRELVEIFTRLSLEANAEKYRQVYGKDVDKNTYEDVIACLSVGNIAWMPICYDWGARTVGYESSAMTSSVLSMRWAFMRGAARQHGGLTATYRSCNFGDASTIFSIGSSFSSPRNLLDNYYSVFSGAGMTWYKMDIWYQYMAGASMFYHEQGFDEFWKPGGTTAAGIKEVQLSPKGMLVDRFLRLTAKQPERGTPVTPVALLVDHAHGWEPAPFWPNSFKNYHGQQERFRYGDHEKMLEEYFWTAFHPIGPKAQAPTTANNEVYVPGVFGDIFDVVFAYPDVNKWRTIDTYPVVIAAGDIELTEAEGKRLAKYIDHGGTLLVADTQFTGPGLKALDLPEMGNEAEADGYRWLKEDKLHPSPRFRYRAIKGGQPVATTADGQVFCAAFERGQGRLLYLSVPRGLSISRQAIPVVPRLFAHLTTGIMPVDVHGDVEWLVNRTSDGWLITLLNPAGQDKPQQGMTPTDYRENRAVTIAARVPVKSASDRLQPTDAFKVEGNTVKLTVLAGSVRIIELK